MFLTSLELWERAFIDLWSIPHFLFGFVAFYLLQKIGFKNNTSFIVVVLAIFWEFAELFFKIEEALTNRFVDVLLTILALVILIILQKTKFNKDEILFKYSSIILVVVSILGWTAFLIRTF